jgi:hypothetical protein
MKSDLYTKFVLTVIALSVIAIQITIKDANAQSFAKDGIERMAICNKNTQGGTYWCVDNVNVILNCSSLMVAGLFSHISKKV